MKIKLNKAYIVKDVIDYLPLGTIVETNGDDYTCATFFQGEIGYIGDFRFWIFTNDRYKDGDSKPGRLRAIRGYENSWKINKDNNMASIKVIKFAPPIVIGSLVNILGRVTKEYIQGKIIKKIDNTYYFVDAANGQVKIHKEDILTDFNTIKQRI